jgi:hypothetical protein
MFLLYNIVSDTMYSVVVCVDFLGTHMASLVCSLKPGVTRMVSSSALRARWIRASPSYEEAEEEEATMAVAMARCLCHSRTRSKPLRHCI